MGKTRIVRIHESLMSVFGDIGRSFADKIKKEYNLDELFVPDMLASQILAGKFKGKKIFNFEISKTGPKKGILKLVR